MMIENGNAADISAFCSAWSPPVYNKTAAIPDWAIPQTNLTDVSGDNDPPVVCMPSTNVAESADVMKKVPISIKPMNERTIPKGNVSNMPNRACSSGRLAMSVPLSCASMAEIPNVVNQMKLMIAGTRSTPDKNSRMVRPLEIRAMKIPTKGAQAIHQAQKKTVQSMIHACS